MAMRPSYDWERLYSGAILETDRSKLKTRIEAAQAAIESRLREMDADHGGAPDERSEIQTALASLGAMRKQVVMPQKAPPGKE